MLARVSLNARPGQSRAKDGCQGKFRIYKGSAGRVFGRATPSTGRLDLRPDQMELTPIEQFPLHGLAGLDADGGCKGQRKADIETRLLALGTTGLNFHRIGGLHFFVIYAFFDDFVKAGL